MKKVFFIAAIISSFAVLTAFTISNSNSPEIALASDYCEGWKDGYCEGWKDVKGPYTICPITPICPMAEMGKHRYNDGYNRGFKSGSSAARN